MGLPYPLKDRSFRKNFNMVLVTFWEPKLVQVLTILQLLTDTGHQKVTYLMQSPQLSSFGSYCILIWLSYQKHTGTNLSQLLCSLQSQGEKAQQIYLKPVHWTRMEDKHRYFKHIDSEFVRCKNLVTQLHRIPMELFC
jgi:hypothetical protein